MNLDAYDRAIKAGRKKHRLAAREIEKYLDADTLIEFRKLKKHIGAEFAARTLKLALERIPIERLDARAREVRKLLIDG